MEQIKTIDELYDFLVEKGMFDTNSGQKAFFLQCLKTGKLDYMLNKFNQMSISFSQEAVENAKKAFYCTCAICGQKKRPDEGAYYKERIKESHINCEFKQRWITPGIIKLVFNVERDFHTYSLFECDKCRKLKENRRKLYKILWISITIAAIIWYIYRTIQLSHEFSFITEILTFIMFTYIAHLFAKVLSKIIVFFVFIFKKSSIPKNIPEESILKKQLPSLPDYNAD